MGGSWKIGRVAGIPIYLHWTFFILLLYVGFQEWLDTRDLAAAGEGVVFMVALFSCVVLHELGHALMARVFGIATEDITLLPIGGVARLKRLPEAPGQELLVALAGPAVNVAIAAALFLVGAIPTLSAFMPEAMSRVTFLDKLLTTNLFLALFNLLPAFPMDGGRVLRALLALGLEYSRATRIAATVGQVMAVGFAFLGLTSNSFFLLIALFVWLGAEQEARQVEERVALTGLQVREAMLTDFHSLAPLDTLGKAADALLAGSQQDFPVLGHAGEAIGVLSRNALMAGLSQAGRDGRVADFLTEGLGSVDAHAPLAPAVSRLREGEGPCLQALEHGSPVGILTLENVGELLMVRSALATTSR